MELGFGYMRLPRAEGGIDMELLCRMVDEFLASGGRYFDTARPYMREGCEEALRLSLTSRHPREKFLLADKLSASYLKPGMTVRALLEDQLRVLGVSYLDYYLLHAVSAESYPFFKERGAFEQCRELKKEGLIRHLGFSFHDSPELLETILTDYADAEFVQLQMNYLDWEDPIIRSKELYEICRRHQKPVFIMEPCRGGLLTSLPQEEADILARAGYASQPEAAFRFDAMKEGVQVILSGMNSLEQIRFNTALFQSMKQLPQETPEALEEACLAATRHYRARGGVGCTACAYCTKGCPKGLNIPGIMGCINTYRGSKAFSSRFYYLSGVTDEKTRASACIGCGACERACPQKLPIRKLLKEAVYLFEEGKDVEFV